MLEELLDELWMILGVFRWSIVGGCVVLVSNRYFNAWGGIVNLEDGNVRRCDGSLASELNR